MSLKELNNRVISIIPAKAGIQKVSMMDSVPDLYRDKVKHGMVNCIGNTVTLH
jgi:hypothetical protein